MKFSNKKVVKSGNTWEIYSTQLPFQYNDLDKKDKKTYDKNSNPIEIEEPSIHISRTDEYIIQNLKRKKDRIRRLISTNFSITNHDKFLTLTFDNDIDITTGYYQFYEFIRKLRSFDEKFAYVAVAEIQPTSQRLHFHLVIKMDYLDIYTIQDLWGHGICYIKKLDGSLSKLANYMAKYFTKDSSLKLKGHRTLLSSKNLIQPKIYYGDHAEFIISALNHLKLPNSYQTYYYSEFCGIIKYQIIILEKDAFIYDNSTSDSLRCQYDHQ